MTRKPSEFGQLEAALRMRDVVRGLAREEVAKIIPGTKYATVVSVDRVNLRATLILQTDVDPVTIPIPNAGGPYDAGDIVLVDTSLGAMKVLRTVYSANAPGGVYVSPFISGLQEGSKDGSVTRRRDLFITGLNTGTTPYLIGRWILDPSAVQPGEFYGYPLPDHLVTVCPGFWAKIKIANSRIFEVYLAPAYGDTTDWQIVPPDSTLDISTAAGPRFGVEYRMGLDDNGNVFIELRARVLASGDGFTTYPWRVDVEIEGNYSLSPDYPFGPTDGTYGSGGTLFNPAGFDTGPQSTSTGWTLTGGGSPAHSITALQWRVKKGSAQILLSIKVGSAITVTAGTGRIASTIFGYVPFWMKPTIAANISTVGTPFLCFGYVANGDGAIIISGIAPNNTLPANTVLQIGASWDL